jgi:hypothetical protein
MRPLEPQVPIGDGTLRQNCRTVAATMMREWDRAMGR